MVVLWVVRRDILESVDERLVKNSIRWDVAVGAFVERESDVLPLAVVELPACDEREDLCANISWLYRTRR